MREIRQENGDIRSVFEFGVVEGEGSEEVVPGSRETLRGLLLQVHGVAEDSDVGAHEGIEDLGVGAYLGIGGGKVVAAGVVAGTGEAEGGGWTGGGEEGGGSVCGGSKGAESAGEAEERGHGGFWG